MKTEYFDLKKLRKMKEETLKKAKTFDELLDIKCGKVGTPVRDEYEAKANFLLFPKY